MKSIVLKSLAVFVIIILILVVIIQVRFGLEQSKIYTAKEFSIREEVSHSNIELGKRIFSVRSACIDCHGADLSGAMIMDNGAMGSIYGANITPFNLSSWSDEEIARAIRYGVHKSGRSLQFMPSFDYEGLSRGDIASVVAYLRSVPAIEKPSHVNSFGPLARVLSVLGKMPVMFSAKFLDLNKDFNEKPNEGPTAEFGKYLANSCVGCHGADLMGGKIPGGDPSWPVAANIRLGANSMWTEANFKEVIRTGISTNSKQKLRAPMPINLLAQMNDDEVRAIWEYLSSLK